MILMALASTKDMAEGGIVDMILLIFAPSKIKLFRMLLSIGTLVEVFISFNLFEYFQPKILEKIYSHLNEILLSEKSPSST